MLRTLNIPKASCLKKLQHWQVLLISGLQGNTADLRTFGRFLEDQQVGVLPAQEAMSLRTSGCSTLTALFFFLYHSNFPTGRRGLCSAMHFWSWWAASPQTPNQIWTEASKSVKQHKLFSLHQPTYLWHLANVMTTRKWSSPGLLKLKIHTGERIGGGIVKSFEGLQKWRYPLNEQISMFPTPTPHPQMTDISGRLEGKGDTIHK